MWFTFAHAELRPHEFSQIEKYSLDRTLSEPKVRPGKRGPVCSMRVRQVDPGRAALFIDLVAFDKTMVATCAVLTKGALIEVPKARLTYSEWETVPKGGGEPRKRSKHSLIAEELEVVGFKS